MICENELPRSGVAGWGPCGSRRLYFFFPYFLNRMKTSHLFCALLLGAGLCATSTAQAQTAPRKAAQLKPRTVPKGETMKEGFVVKEGRVLMTSSGQTAPLQADVTLPSGVKVSTAGAVTMTDGSTAQLQEGDQLSPTGRLTTAAMCTEQQEVASQMQTKDKKGKKGKHH